MENYTAQQFINALNTNEGMEKVAGLMTQVISTALKPLEFNDKIIPQKPTNKAALLPGMDTDEVGIVVQLQPRSKAMITTFRDHPKAQFIQAKRVLVPFFNIMTDKEQKTEEELLAYSVPITDWIRQNQVDAIALKRDWMFLKYAEEGIQLLQYIANTDTYTEMSTSNYDSVVKNCVCKGAGALDAVADDFTIHPIQRSDLVDVLNLLAVKPRLLTTSNQNASGALLMTSYDHNGLLKLIMTDIGSALAGETFLKGLDSQTLMGQRIVVTNSTDILRPGNVYAFVAPDFLGINQILDGVKFWVEKKGNVLSWYAWTSHAMAFINVDGMAKLELYSGSVTPTHLTAGYAAVQPYAEDQVYSPPARDGEGEYVPEVSY